eukprot:3132605-Amphidinium_carterae.1
MCGIDSCFWGVFRACHLNRGKKRHWQELFTSESRPAEFFKSAWVKKIITSPRSNHSGQQSGKSEVEQTVVQQIDIVFTGSSMSLTFLATLGLLEKRSNLLWQPCAHDVCSTPCLAHHRMKLFSEEPSVKPTPCHCWQQAK